MTTLLPVTKTCVLCGTPSEQVEVMSSNTLFGGPDLDTRPAEMLRSTLPYWVQRCPHCGYCSGDLAQNAGDLTQVKTLVESSAYQAQLHDSSLSDPAPTFLCSALIQAQATSYALAGWGCIHAAWVCDDAENSAGAKRCRKQAAEFLQQARQRGQIIIQQRNAGEVVLVDVLRRSEQFELALSLCEEAQRHTSDSTLEAVLRFQSMLITSKDTGCYTVAQALGNV